MSKIKAPRAPQSPVTKRPFPVQSNAPQPSLRAPGTDPLGSSLELEDFAVLKFKESAWLQAIIAADRWRDGTWPAGVLSPAEGDTSSIVALLRARLDASAETIGFGRLEIQLLADLLDRHCLRQKPGGRRVPVYRNSWAELRVEAPSALVDDLRASGMSLREALKTVAGDDHHLLRQLEAFRARKRGSSRRKK